MVHLRRYQPTYLIHANFFTLTRSPRYSSFEFFPLHACACTTTSTAAIVKNIKTDFGAKCDGVANDVQAFTNFHEWALNWQKTNTGLIELDIPSGSVCEFITSTGVTGITGNNFSGRFFAMGVKQLLVVGYGATLSDNNGTGAGFFLGGSGQNGIADPNAPASARTQRRRPAPQA